MQRAQRLRRWFVNRLKREAASTSRSIYTVPSLLLKYNNLPFYTEKIFKPQAQKRTKAKKFISHSSSKFVPLAVYFLPQAFMQRGRRLT
jgi:hypothetical protein